MFEWKYNVTENEIRFSLIWMAIMAMLVVLEFC